MEITWSRCIALPFAVMGLAPSASAQTATAGVRAEVVPLPESAAEVAAEWLMSNSPGAFTLRIPGSTQATAIAVTAQTPNASSGTIDFLMSSEGAAALRQLLTQMASSAEAASGGLYQLSSSAADGTMRKQGVQMILMNSPPNGDGGGVIIAIITFD